MEKLLAGGLEEVTMTKVQENGAPPPPAAKKKRGSERQLVKDVNKKRGEERQLVTGKGGQR